MTYGSSARTSSAPHSAATKPSAPSRRRFGSAGAKQAAPPVSLPTWRQPPWNWHLATPGTARFAGIALRPSAHCAPVGRSAAAARRFIGDVRTLSVSLGGDPGSHLTTSPRTRWSRHGRSKTNWLLEHGSVLLVRKTGARALEAFLSRAVKAVPGAATASKLSDIADVVRGSHVPREELTEAKGATGPPYIRVGDIQPDGPRPPARALRAASAEARTLQPDDVLVTLSGSVGRVARVPDTWADAVPSANLAVISPLPGVRPEYLASLLATAPYQTWLEGRATGATVQHLRLGGASRPPHSRPRGGRASGPSRSPCAPGTLPNVSWRASRAPPRTTTPG